MAKAKKTVFGAIFCLWFASVYAYYVSTALRYHDVRAFAASLKERLQICR